MPLYHCSKCHHEWEGKNIIKCDWCGSFNSYILEKRTKLEKFIEDGLIYKVLNEINKGSSE